MITEIFCSFVTLQLFIVFKHMTQLQLTTVEQRFGMAIWFFSYEVIYQVIAITAELYDTWDWEDEIKDKIRHIKSIIFGRILNK
jgi:hypothetical protein